METAEDRQQAKPAKGCRSLREAAADATGNPWRHDEHEQSEQEPGRCGSRQNALSKRTGALGAVQTSFEEAGKRRGMDR
jgi:hypothetical protein